MSSETHTGVVIGTFPETRLIILLIHRTIFRIAQCHSPFLLSKMLLPHSSATDGREDSLRTEILIESICPMIFSLLTHHWRWRSYDLILPMLSNHTAIRTQAFISSIGYTADDALYLMQQYLIAKTGAVSWSSQDASISGRNSMLLLPFPHH